MPVTVSKGSLLAHASDAGRGDEQREVLRSLTTTMDKLRKDEERHRLLVEDMGKRLKPKYCQTEHTAKSFNDCGYIFVRTLGQGRFGMVKMAKKKSTQFVNQNARASISRSRSKQDLASSFVAIRIIPRKRMRGTRVVNEEMFSTKEKYKALMLQIEALRKLDHPNICREMESFEDSQNIYIVMELLTGGNLLQSETSAVPEARAARILESILAGMSHAHANKIVHQDLRPDNVHYATADPDARVVVTDWSCANFIDTLAQDSRRNLVYSEYSAPELSPDERTDRGDIWSIGVIAFALLCLELPFLDAAGSPEIPLRDFDWGDRGRSFSPECRDFVKQLLRLDPAKRLPARQALDHPWMQQARKEAVVPPRAVMTSATNILEFRGHDMLHKAVASFAAHHLSGHQLHELTLAFQRFDLNRDGVIDREEMFSVLTSQLKAAREPPEGEEVDSRAEDALEEALEDSATLAAAFTALDTDGSGNIGYTEFLAAAAASLMQESVHLCWEGFRSFDVDGNGVLHKQELARVLQTPEVTDLLDRLRSGSLVNPEIKEALDLLGGPPESIEDVLERMDSNKDSAVTFDEFVRALLGKEVKENAHMGKGPPSLRPRPEQFTGRRRSSGALPAALAPPVSSAGNAFGHRPNSAAGHGEEPEPPAKAPGQTRRASLPAIPLQRA